MPKKVGLGEMEVLISGKDEVEVELPSTPKTVDASKQFTPPTVKRKLSEEEERLKQELRDQTSSIPLTIMSTPTRKGSSSSSKIQKFSPSLKISSYKPSPSAASSQQLLLNQSSNNSVSKSILK